MRLGIIGSGMIVNDFLSNCKKIEGIEIVAITGTTSGIEKLKNIAEKYNIPEYYENIQDMLSLDYIDTVYIAVPNHLHFINCKLSLENNKHVICEKPFTSNLNELKELEVIASHKNLFLLEAVTTHYLPNTIELKKRLGEIGDIKIINMNYSQYSSRYNSFKEGIIQPAFDPSKSGGALMDLNIYNINLMVNLFGEPTEVKYYANITKDIDTSGVLILNYENFTAVCIGAKDCKAPTNTTIQGDKGFISIPTPANVLMGFKVEEAIEKGFVANDRTGVLDFNNNQHRMYYEFVEFERIIREKDYKKAKEILEISFITMDIQTKARLSANIVFDADK
ncbi:MAG: Gfo/Idh/MocA family oxidoreductase [Erysipelotrichaceae bacterium]|nr:Gfo/Idh/MocA family oxidoreductase [Erysipelotrichaceae bacterium]